MKTRKHAFMLSVAVLLLLSTGCGSDSTGTEPPNKDENRIVGTWNLVSLVVSMQGTEMDMTTVDPCLLETTNTFEADGDYHSTFAIATDDGECRSDNTTGTWERESGNTYTINAEGLGAGTREIAFSEGNSSFSFSETNIYGDIEGEATITFKRQ